MASYRGHLAASCPIGFIYGGIARTALDLDPATAMIGAGVTAIGGLIPDLDSDSGVPIRELFGLSAAVVPLLLITRLSDTSLNEQEILVTMALIYATIRWGCSRIVKRLTVHRGMFHSIPAMLIAGAVTYLAYDSGSFITRSFLAVGVMLGFLSHLVLDELYAIDFRGLRIEFNQFAGSAIKFWSKSWIATLSTYAILGIVGFAVVEDVDAHLPGGLYARMKSSDVPKTPKIELPQPNLGNRAGNSPFSIILGEPTRSGATNVPSEIPQRLQETSETPMGRRPFRRE